MANTKLNKLPDGTIELTVTVPWSTIADTYEKVVVDLVENAELAGFRKGKAPRKLVEEKLDKGQTYEEVLKRVVPQVYNEAITEHKLHPVVNPKVELKEATEGKDWIIRMLTCEKPELKLGDYKGKITELKASKKPKIWVPGQSQPTEAEKAKELKPTLDELLKAIYESVTVTLAQILLDNEVNRLLSELIDQTKKLGLTVEQYLSSTGRSAEALKAEYTEQGKRTLTLEFALEEIADKEGILISDDELDEVIKNAKTEEEKESLSKQRYFLATLLRRQKTLDFLAAL